MAKRKTMTAGVFLGDARIEVRELPLPVPGYGEVRLRVTACGVCGTDFHIYHGHLTDGVFPPVVLGHEIAARVDELGPGVTGLTPGQFAAIDPVIGCGVCVMCRSARPNLCSTPTIIGYKQNGGFAQYVLAPASKVVPLAESVGPAGGVLCETLACVVNGYDKLNFRAGSTALVLGAGTVGVLWAQMLKSSLCRLLLQTEVVPFRRRQAAKLGADVVIDPSADLAGKVRKLLPEGVDYIIDATGSPPAIEQALPLLARGGTFMVFGVCPAGSKLSFDPFVLYNKEARIIASKMPPMTLDRSARLIESGRIANDKIVTATLPLSALADAIAGFEANAARQIKVAVDPWI
jgi:L-iditol 2-dehydrogenase